MAIVQMWHSALLEFSYSALSFFLALLRWDRGDLWMLAHRAKVDTELLYLAVEEFIKYYVD